ncbi:MAG TPA: four helix bundle protein [Byssovorax sp.]|jgi:four helix bundle protein
MLRIYPVMIEMLAALRPVVRQVERRDADLARQLRRAAASVALNTAEGMGSQGGLRRVRYHSALGSARETMACLEVARALHGVALDAALARQLDAIIGTLVRLVV